MSEGLFTVTPNKLETRCTVEYQNKSEAWSVEFDYRKLRSGWVKVVATHLDRVFSSGTRTERRYPVHIFRGMIRHAINHQKFADYLMDYHLVTNKVLGDKYPGSWLSRMYPNNIHEIIRRALIFDLGTKKICRVAWAINSSTIFEQSNSRSSSPLENITI